MQTHLPYSITWIINFVPAFYGRLQFFVKILFAKDSEKYLKDISKYLKDISKYPLGIFHGSLLHFYRTLACLQTLAADGEGGGAFGGRGLYDYDEFTVEGAHRGLREDFERSGVAVAA